MMKKKSAHAISTENLDALVQRSVEVLCEQVEAVSFLVKSSGIQSLRPCELNLPARAIECVTRLRLALSVVQQGGADDALLTCSVEDLHAAAQAAANLFEVSDGGEVGGSD